MGTLLHVAIAEHHVEAINMLEAHGSNAALCDSDGNSCFHLAVDYGLELTRSQRKTAIAQVTSQSAAGTGDARGLVVRVHSSVWSRGSNGTYKRGIVTYLSPDEATATIKNSDGRTIRDVPGTAKDV